jgi:RimJ/RimL family protein N-acetyltransferase
VPATYLWITTTVRELARLDWPVRPDAVFVYKTFTVDAWRGRGLNQAAVTWALDDCRRSGARTAFVDVDAANHASLRALRRAGFADVARFRTLKLGPATLTLMDDAVFSRVAGRSRRDRSGSSAAAKEHPCPR